jgi:hypothetical protein
MEKHILRAIIFCVFAAVIATAAAMDFASMWKPDTLHPSARVSPVHHLHDYCPSLEGTRGDAEIYIIDSDTPGTTCLVLGGTHPNEPAGFMTAVVLIENARVTRGRLIVIPQACSSGFTSTDPLEGCPEHFTIPTPTGPRTFRFGARAANPVDQWPDPLVFLQYPSGQQLSGNETRNLNRSYPGKPDGTLTERVAYAIMQLIRNEHVGIAVDLHEAAPEIPIINAIVTHPKCRDLAGEAVLNLELSGLQYSLELSPDNFHGLSHREWGDRTDALPFLMETSNPIQGRLRGPTTEKLLVEGVDERYCQASQLGAMRITYECTGEPISLRVGRHLQGLRALFDACAGTGGMQFSVDGFPSYDEITARGIGNWLH